MEQATQWKAAGALQQKDARTLSRKSTSKLQAHVLMKLYHHCNVTFNKMLIMLNVVRYCRCSTLGEFRNVFNHVGISSSE